MKNNMEKGIVSLLSKAIKRVNEDSLFFSPYRVRRLAEWLANRYGVKYFSIIEGGDVYLEVRKEDKVLGRVKTFTGEVYKGVAYKDACSIEDVAAIIGGRSSGMIETLGTSARLEDYFYTVGVEVKGVRLPKFHRYDIIFCENGRVVVAQNSAEPEEDEVLAEIKSSSVVEVLHGSANENYLEVIKKGGKIRCSYPGKRIFMRKDILLGEADLVPDEEGDLLLDIDSGVITPTWEETDQDPGIKVLEIKIEDDELRSEIEEEFGNIKVTDGEALIIGGFARYVAHKVVLGNVLQVNDVDFTIIGQLGVTRVFTSEDIEFTAPHKTVAHFFAKCDFTINEVAVRADGTLLISERGLCDLKKGVVAPTRTDGPTGRELARAIRFAVEFGFDIEEALVDPGVLDDPDEMDQFLFITTRYAKYEGFEEKVHELLGIEL